MQGGSVNSGNDGSIWRWNSGDESLHLIAREGDVANSTDGAVCVSITSFTCSGAGEAAFSASLMPGIGDTLTSTNIGVWQDRGQGVPELVLRRGDSYQIGEDDTRTVVGINLDSDANHGGGTGGYGRSLSDGGSLLLRLHLSGGTSGVFLQVED